MPNHSHPHVSRPHVSRLLLLTSALLLTPPSFAQSADPAANSTTAASNPQLQADVQRQLNKKQFRDVQPQIAGNVVTLTGTVSLLADKLDAAKRIDKTHEAASVQNNIVVNTGEVSDAQLLAKLSKGLAFDRQGYPSFPFNSIGLQVKNGAVLLTGEVVEPVDKDSAISLVANTKGVRALVDQLKVAPPSPVDWQIRRAMYQAVYGASVSAKYAIDPGKPIRIVVDNGHVVLTGAVINAGDKEIIGLRAQTVPGVFSVNNLLQVQGSNPEHP